ncbi:MAG: diadenylate cyclase CdaA [Bacteroidaceae bacterium]|nr:diadenylate cyclase CdaA [Bacteroidaceae bacterium]
MFFDISIKDIIDVVLVALMLYYMYRLMKDSGSLNVFVGILVFIFSWLFVSKMLQMRLLGSILDQLMSVGTLALVVIFQEEIRNFFRTLGSHRHFGFLSKFFSRDKKDSNATEVMPVVLACNSMAQQKVGALIVVQRNMSLDDIVKTGETINANISQRLVEAVFFKNAPLHDGAMIIQNGRITAAQCILPVSHNMNISKKLGLRHRSAIGVTEIYDAIAIVVSEETGTISAAIGGKLIQNLDARKLEEILTKQK